MQPAPALHSKTSTAETSLDLDAAIALLEKGEGANITVDLGDGRLARPTGHRGADGLLQRLRAHRMILALGAGPADLTAFSGTLRPLTIAPQVQDILDAISVKPVSSDPHER
jgi:hypothetical protein